MGRVAHGGSHDWILREVGKRPRRAVVYIQKVRVVVHEPTPPQLCHLLEAFFVIWRPKAGMMLVERAYHRLARVGARE